ncbi:thaumatin [Mycena leptocephala]|nr:thaumatin [Mycena leptocephala]
MRAQTLPWIFREEHNWSARAAAFDLRCSGLSVRPYYRIRESGGRPARIELSQELYSTLAGMHSLTTVTVRLETSVPASVLALAPCLTALEIHQARFNGPASSSPLPFTPFESPVVYKAWTPLTAEKKWPLRKLRYLRLPQFFTSSGGQPVQPPGWEAQPNTAVTFAAPNDWNGRIWSDATVISRPVPVQILTLMDVVMAAYTGTGFTGDPGHDSGPKDVYTVSVVDEANLPMSLFNNGGCGVASCPVDLVTSCPLALAGPFDSASVPAGWKSTCLVDALASNVGVEHYTYFKSSCPNAFVYAFDKSSGTAIWECARPRMFDVDKRAWLLGPISYFFFAYFNAAWT